MASNDLIDDMRSILLKRSDNGKKKLFPEKLIASISKQLSIDEFALKDVFKQLKENEEIAYTDSMKGLPITPVTVREQVTRYSEEELNWKKTLTTLGLSETECNILFVLYGSISVFCESDRVLIIKGLIEIKKDQKTLAGMSRFNVSAKYLLGSSKLLDSLSRPALISFGIDLNLFTSPPSYIVVAGPGNPKAVILVENPQAFEAALNANLDNSIAWVVTYGYGLSNISNETGNQLVSNIENNKKLTMLVRSGNPPPIEKLLSNENIYFWGDLDPEGLKIFKRLRNKLPALKLSGLYSPMINILNMGKANKNHHPYVKSTGKLGQKKWISNDKKLCSLIELCSERGVDQEAIHDEYLTYDLSMLSLNEVKK